MRNTRNRRSFAVIAGVLMLDIWPLYSTGNHFYCALNVVAIMLLVTLYKYIR